MLTSKRNYEKVVELIVEKDLGAKVSNIQDSTTGYSGHVYIVEVDGFVATDKVAVKVVEIEGEVPFQQESSNNRVYGSRWSNLRPSHDLLISYGLPVYKLYSVGQLSEHNVNYFIMEALEGESVREFLAYKTHVEVNQLHRLAGETMGRMHRITRDFQGWISMPTPQPDSKDWQTTFFESAANHLVKAAQRNNFIREHRSLIDDFYLAKKREWTDPKQFVYSHTDGFQGMAKYENGKWQLTGLIDIEDNQFTDPRFVLTGYELALEYEKRKAPADFWEGYKQYTTIDESYQNLKPLFKLYYLISWFTNVVYDDFRGKPDEQPDTIKYFEQLIAEIVMN